MRIVWSPINQAWFVMFHDILCGIGPESRRIFQTRAEVRAYIKPLGLKLDGCDIVLDYATTYGN